MANLLDEVTGRVLVLLYVLLIGTDLENRTLAAVAGCLGSFVYIEELDHLRTGSRRQVSHRCNSTS